MADSVDILIIGCGPAGASTALHLTQSDPGWSDRILMLDRAKHPRDKLCGGILSFLALDILHSLGLRVKVPSEPVSNIIIKFLDTHILFSGDGLFQVIRRSEFDAWLLNECRGRGIAVSEQEEVLHLEEESTHVTVTTSKRNIRAKLVVAADGTTGICRRLLFPGERTHLCRLLEILTPADPHKSWEFRHQAAYSDWSPICRGVQGYYWDIPSYVEGTPMMNRGIFDSRVNSRLYPESSLRDEFAQLLSQSNVAIKDFELKGFPIRPLTRRTPLSRERVLFVGDAAGADPLAGEGIAFALGYGRPAAAQISDAFSHCDQSLADYGRRLKNDPYFRHLLCRVNLANLTYRFKNPVFLKIALKWVAESFSRDIERRLPASLRPQLQILPTLSGRNKEEIEPFLYYPEETAAI